MFILQKIRGALISTVANMQALIKIVLIRSKDCIRL